MTDLIGDVLHDEIGLVGARGVEPPGPITRIIVPDHIAVALRDVA